MARYVVLNPVRARMVRDTARWPCSSYHAMTGAHPAPVWLQTNWLLEQFSSRRARRGKLHRIRAPDRNQAIAAAYATGDYTMQQIAEHFEVHYATVSRAIRQVEE